MKRLDADSQELKSADVVAENVERLKELFPEAFAAEGKLDFDVLKQLLGGQVDEREERYGLNWHGKRQARQLALTPSTGTLRPCPEESVDWDTTKNIFIEGDNLEVLKLLQKSYAGKVKLIYIDPPYNTGNDFIYPDTFEDGVRHYLEVTGQREGGAPLTSNAETNGRFHTDWLNMIYPRLKLARTFLRNDGVLFISIGREEAHNLRLVCDDVFGAENYCGDFVWEKKKKPSFLDRNMGTVTDFVITYARDRSQSPAFVAGAVEDGKKYPFNNAGNALAVLAFPPKSVRFQCSDGLVPAQDMSEGKIKTRLLDDVSIKSGRNESAFRLEGEWRYSQSKLDEFVAAGDEIVISKIPFRPNYVNRSGEPKKTANLLSYRVNDIPTNEDATAELHELFGADVFSYPKPAGLLAYLVRSVVGDGEIVMDFFAGSGTTAHAVAQQSRADGRPRASISVQLPEPLDHADAGNEPAIELLKKLSVPTNIAELTKERLRRAMAQLRGGAEAGVPADLGFRVFKLATSNIEPWDPATKDVAGSMEKALDNVKPDRSADDLLYDVLLKTGLDLCVPIERKEIAKREVQSVGGGVLFTCFSDKKIKASDAEPLALGIVAWRNELAPANPKECRVVFRDSAFESDVAKSNLAAILKQHGFDEKLIASL